MSLGKCEGFEFACGDPAEWTVEGTIHRDEWIACERCAREALLYTYADVVDADGVKQMACRGDGMHRDHLLCPATEGSGAW